jgi:uncharacterized protein YgiM (DUF1202 family)
MYDDTIFFGYEVTVDNNYNVSYRARARDEINADTTNNKKPIFQGLKKDNTLLNNYWLKEQKEEDDYVNPSQINIVDGNENDLYDLSGLFENDYICHYEINRKKNKLALLLSDKKDYGSFRGINTYVVEFAVIYDGIINDNRVRLRSEAGLSGEIRGHLNRGDKVKVIDRNDEKQKIGNMEDYWYLVKTENGQEGWAYGAYIDIEGE